MKNWSKKKKTVIVVSIVLLVAVVAGIIVYALKPDENSKIVLTSLQNHNITQKLETSGTVESANQGKFTVLDGVIVDKVNVRVGDKISKGDLIATFDTSSLSSLLKEKKKAFESAESAYEKYIKDSESASVEVASVNSEIEALQKEMDELQVKVDKENGEADDEPVKAENEVGGKLFNLLGIDSSDTVIGKIANMLGGNGKTSSAISAILNGSSMGSFDISSIGSALGASDNEQKLISDTLEMVQLKARQVLLSTQSSTALESVYKAVYDNAKAAYEQTSTSVEQLKKGWYAENDGIIREVNITAGTVYMSNSDNAASQVTMDISTILSMVTSGSETTDITSLLSGLFAKSNNGVVVEYFPFEVKFVLGKYDVSKVSMDQEATITTINGDKLKGSVVYISPVASSENSINISSLLGSSGSSSGVEVRVAVPEPDESVIIGFDVDISLDVQTSENALLVPMSSLQYDSDGLIYVYVYNSENRTVTKTEIKTGLFDGTFYEVVSGLSADDIIVKSPQTTINDGDKIVVKDIEEPKFTEAV